MEAGKILSDCCVHEGNSLKLAGIASAAVSLLALAGAAASLLSGRIIQTAILLVALLASFRIPAAYAGMRAAIARREMGRELPFFLSKYSHYLRLGLNPVKALWRCAGSGRTPLESLVRRALLDSGKGKPLEKALADRAARIGSEDVSEGTLALISVLSAGGEGSREMLEGIGARLAERREAELERYSARSQVVFLGIVFATAVLPALAGFAAATGGMPAGLLAFLYLLVFPATAAAAFAYLRYSSP